MPTPVTAQSRIAALQEQIERLKTTAILELKERRVQLAQELHEVDCEIGRLTGNKPEGTKRHYVKRTPAPARNLSLQELKDMLAAAPEKTLSIRKDNLDLASIKTLAAADPGLLKMGGKGPWPTVTLLK
jgi:hypothetical protein